MTHAYSEFYINDAMENLGEMFDYAIVDCGISPEEFFEWFIRSGISECFEKGNPKYVAGMSGVELAMEVAFQTTGARLEIVPIQKDFRGPEYWAGWIMAYYQWYRGVRFSYMVENGLTISKVMSLYLLHEADVSKFVEMADEILNRERKEKPTNLCKIRKARGLTQQKLSELSGVSLRMVQLYEQRQNDIGKAQARVLMYLVKVLGCEIEDLLED